MKTLEEPLTALEWSGLWRPVHWHPAAWKTKLYNLYTVLSLFLLGSFTLAQFIEMINSLDDVQAAANNSFLMLTLLSDCGKAANVLAKRGAIIQLTNSLLEDPCRPRSEKEMVIQRKFDYAVRFNLLRYTAVVMFTLTIMVSRSFVDDIPQRLLPSNVWLPFDTQDSPLGYWLAYSHQIISICISCGVGIAFDTFVPTLMLQTCAQLNILKHRFLEIPQQVLFDTTRNTDEPSFSFILNAESKLLSYCVKHHLKIFKFAEELNHLFGLMIFLQYSASTLVICASMFEMAQMKIFSPPFVVLFVYIAEMSVQIVMYCFYGGEVTIESTSLCDAIYEMDWTVLSVNSKRSLLTIMARTTRPIQFTSGHILTMNLESFKKLLKLSYSTFNVLQSTKG